MAILSINSLNFKGDKLSSEKKILLLSIESWLINRRDPDFMAYEILPHITG